MARSLTYMAEDRSDQPPTSADLSIVLVGDSTQIQDAYNDQQAPHLLMIAQEIREKIYGYINDDIQKNRIVAWNYNIRTEYEGLRFTCRQLYRETFDRIFHYKLTSLPPSNLPMIPITRTTFHELRMLTVKINQNAASSVYDSFCETLNRLQITIQELHILFVGEDHNGVKTEVHGCGNLIGWGDGSSEHREPLQISGQDIRPMRLDLYRQLSLMRELRVLRVRNANFPLLPGMLLVNKPHLQALSVLCDPRTVVHSCRNVSRHLPQNWLTIANNLSPVRALELTANAMMPASATVKRLAYDLEHLTWTIPRFDYQREAGAQLSHKFYREVGNLVQYLSRQAPKLSVLRLCISMRQMDTWQDMDDVDGMVDDFRRYLRDCRRLEHFEIHSSGGTQFFRDNLISFLPANLKRLHITDSVLAPKQLQEKIWRRYFEPLAQRKQEDSRHPGTPVLGDRCLEDNRCETEAPSKFPASDEVFITVNEHGLVSYSANEEMQQKSASHSKMLVCHRKLTLEEDNECLIEDGQFCRERKFRGEAIPLNIAQAGSLGCITYEYDCTEGSEEDGFRPAPNDQWESDTTTMLRLCGKLLDRERHLHLRYEPSTLIIEGIRPPKMSTAKSYLQNQEAMPETARYSCHGSIHSAIYNEQDLKPKQFVVEENHKALSQCLGEDWYFGSEDEAMKVFELEPSAKMESQRPRSTLDVVDSCRDGRCRWMSPDYDICPVGDLPTPILPRDWQSDLHI